MYLWNFQMKHHALPGKSSLRPLERNNSKLEIEEKNRESHSISRTILVIL